jgi:hypothetical protein
VGSSQGRPSDFLIRAILAASIGPLGASPPMKAALPASVSDEPRLCQSVSLQVSGSRIKRLLTKLTQISGFCSIKGTSLTLAATSIDWRLIEVGSIACPKILHTLPAGNAICSRAF